MKIISLIFFLTTVFFLNGCSETSQKHKQEEKEVEVIDFPNYLGQYLVITKNEYGLLELRQNCESKSLQQIELNAFGDYDSGYYLALDKEGNRMFEFKNYTMNSDTLQFYGEPQETTNGDQATTIKFYKINNNQYQVELEGIETYLLTPINHQNDYPIISCSEEESEPVSLISEKDLVFEILKVLDLLHTQGEDLSHYHNQVIVEHPGPGLHPIIDTLYEKVGESVQATFTSKEYQRCKANIQLHIDEEKSFIVIDDKLPDFCAPNQEMLFIQMKGLDTQEAHINILLSYLDENSGEYYTLGILEFTYDTQLWLKRIDLKDCGA